jgi:peptidoglycan/xylan/chitin deacetylase (PgdA/CDA1 family)
MSAARSLKRFVAGALASDPMTAVMQPLTRGVASVLMMHRFADPARQNAGHDAAMLRAHLGYLRRMRYELVGIGELARRLENRDTRLGKTVAFTIDDGYADYATIGAPVFEEFDCPATVFVVTGVVDDGGWYWWDKLRVAFEMAARRMLVIEIAGEPLRLEWSDNAGAARAARTIVDRMKGASDAERRRILDSIPEAVEADVPGSPPPRYAAMTWDEVRACGRGVTTFGAHTVTHPILARTDDAGARSEIETSWRRLSAETSAAIPVFCYPNGAEGDLGPRETGILREIGMTAAVTSRPGYATVAAFHRDADARFLVPRFPYGGETNELVQFVNGVERMKMAVRRAVTRRGDS